MTTDTDMNGRRKQDWWDNAKNISLIAGFLINAVAFAYWIGTSANELHVTTTRSLKNSEDIQAISNVISTKHMDKIEIKDFVDRGIRPIQDKLDKIDDNVLTLMRSGGVTVQEYNMKARN